MSVILALGDRRIQTSSNFAAGLQGKALLMAKAMICSPQLTTKHNTSDGRLSRNSLLCRYGDSAWLIDNCTAFFLDSCARWERLKRWP
jgi:hypothetical protein